MRRWNWKTWTIIAGSTFIVFVAIGITTFYIATNYVLNSLSSDMSERAEESSSLNGEDSTTLPVNNGQAAHSSENRDISDQPSSNDGTTGNDPNGSSSEISESNGEGASGSQGSGSRSEGEGASGSQVSSSESVEGSSLGEGGDPGSSGSGSSSSESGTSGSEPSRSGTGSSAQIINTEDEILEARDNITLAERIKLSTTLLKHFSMSEMQTFMQLASGGLNQKEKKAARDVFMDRLSPKEYDDLIVIAAKYGLSQGKKYEEHLDK